MPGMRLHRISLYILLGCAAAAGQSLNCDLRDYKPMDGLKAAATDEICGTFRFLLRLGFQASTLQTRFHKNLSYGKAPLGTFQGKESLQLSLKKS